MNIFEYSFESFFFFKYNFIQILVSINILYLSHPIVQTTEEKVMQEKVTQEAKVRKCRIEQLEQSRAAVSWMAGFTT